MYLLVGFEKLTCVHPLCTMLVAIRLYAYRHKTFRRKKRRNYKEILLEINTSMQKENYKKGGGEFYALTACG